MTRSLAICCVFFVWIVPPVSAAVILDETFDTSVISNPDLFTVPSGEVRIFDGSLILLYSTSPASPPTGIECTIPLTSDDPSEREIEMTFLGGGSELSNSLFISYAVGSGSGFALPPFGYGQMANSRTGDRTGYTIHFLRHGDGTNEILFYRVDTGWVKRLKTEWLPANPITTLRKAVINHRRDGRHRITVTFDTGVSFERDFRFEDDAYPPGRVQRRIQWVGKAHTGLRGAVQMRADRWTVRDANRWFAPSRETSRRPAVTRSRKKIDVFRELQRAREFYARGDYVFSRDLCRHILDQAPSNASTLDLLGLSEQALFNYSAAHRHFHAALDLRRQTLGPSHPDVAESLQHLADIYVLKDVVQAEQFYRRSLAIRENVQGETHPAVAVGRRQLAAFYQSIGDPASAERLYRLSLSSLETSRESADPIVTESRISLARFLSAQGRDDEAETLFLRTLSVLELAGREDSPDAISILHFLETLYQSQNRNGELEGIYKRLVEATEKTMGPDHPEVARRLHNLATLYVKTNPAEAERLYIRSLEITEKAQGKNHPYMVLGLYNLAQLYHVQGQFQKAERLYLQAYSIIEKEVSPNHQREANILDKLGRLYLLQNRLEAAETYFLGALKTRQKSSGAGHPDLMPILDNLAIVYQKMGRLDKAGEFRKLSDQIRGKVKERPEPEN